MMKWALLLLVLSSSVLAQTPVYDRGDWPHWEDYDADCQNARHELLIASSLVPVTFTRADRCTVATGRWQGPYTGLSFTRARQVDIDHVIPLKYAHDHGGAGWDRLTKALFANDPANLLVTQASANRSKGSRGPSGYLPRAQYRCEYAVKWRTLAKKYGLKLAAPDAAVVLVLLAKRCLMR